MLDSILGAWVDLRTRFRGLALPLFAMPFFPAAIVAAMAGHDRMVVGDALAIGLSILAARIVRRGRSGDARRAAWLMAVGTGLGAHLGAGMGGVLPFLLAGGAWLGTRMMYEALPEAPPPPPPPEPPPEPEQPAVPPLVTESRARLARIEAAAERLADPKLRSVADAMEAVLDDLTARPERLDMARRFLNVQLDGLERITARLEAGAAPPATLRRLLDDLRATAEELRGRLRREESEALEIQVKVMSDRLREDGYR